MAKTCTLLLLLYDNALYFLVARALGGVLVSIMHGIKRCTRANKSTSAHQLGAPKGAATNDPIYSLQLFHSPPDM